MAVFYTGYRNVTKGRNSNDNVNPWNGRSENYSNYSIFNTSHVLEGMPNEDHVPGTGRHPHGLKLSRIYRGLEDRTQPLDDPGMGPRQEGARYRPLENKAAGNNLVFKAGYGHDIDTPVRENGDIYSYSNYKHDGITQPYLSGDYGHTVRAIDTDGTANTFGRFNPNLTSDRHVGPQPMEDPGDTLPEGYDNEYGHNKVLEWRGVTSAKALDV